MLTSHFLPMTMDHFLQHWINCEETSPLLDCVMAAITNYSAWLPILIGAIIGIIFFGNFKMRVMLLCLAVALGFTDGILVNTIKHMVGRPRPLQIEPGVRVVHLAPASPQILTLFSTPIVNFPKMPPLGTKVVGRSFPSSHTANIFVSATVLFLFYRRWGFLFYFIASLVLYSRIYTGAHWPLDVAVGACLGIIDGTIIVFLMNQLWEKWGTRFAPALARRHPTLFF